jgi:putative DNA primase/helicase
MSKFRADLVALRNALGGEISGGQVFCPGPGHSRKDRSLAVRPKEGGGFLVHSFANDDWPSCDAYVRSRLGCGQWQPGLNGHAAQPRQSEEADYAKRKQRVRQIWDAAIDPRGTAVEEYLASRKLILPPELCGTVLRFHPACAWGTNGGRAACLIAAYRERTNDEVVAIHRIRVDQPGLWPKTERKMLGPVTGAAIKLDAATIRSL